MLLGSSLRPPPLVLLCRPQKAPSGPNGVVPEREHPSGGSSLDRFAVRNPLEIRFFGVFAQFRLKRWVRTGEAGLQDRGLDTFEYIGICFLLSIREDEASAERKTSSRKRNSWIFTEKKLVVCWWPFLGDFDTSAASLRPGKTR